MGAAAVKIPGKIGKLGQKCCAGIENGFLLGAHGDLARHHLVHGFSGGIGVIIDVFLKVRQLHTVDKGLFLVQILDQQADGPDILRRGLGIVFDIGQITDLRREIAVGTVGQIGLGHWDLVLGRERHLVGVIHHLLIERGSKQIGNHCPGI